MFPHRQSRRRFLKQSLLGGAASCLVVQAAGGAEKASSATVRRTPLVLTEGGTPEKPAIFDGRDLVVDLGIDVSDHDWIREDEGRLWRSRGPLQPESTPVTAGQMAGFFLGERPLRVPRDLEAERRHPDRKGKCYLAPEALSPGEMGYADDGGLYFRWPAGMDPADLGPGLPLILPPKPGTSGVVIACSHIIVRNLSARYAANDGFNIHGRWKGIRLEKVRAISNGDEGISAHDEVEMEVDGAEVAWNGSAAGGVADVNDCITRYRNCEVHDNLGAGFFFSGKSHHVEDSVVYHQSRDVVVRDGTKFTRENLRWVREGLE